MRHRDLLPAILLLLLALPAAASPAAFDVSGPLRVENPYPPILPFLLPPAEAPSRLPPGGATLTWAATYGNAFHWDPGMPYEDLSVLIDGEMVKLTVDADCRPAAGLAVGASLSLVGAYGGFLDPVIQGFHGLFGLPNGGREWYPDNRFGFRVVRSGVAMIDLDQPFWAFGDLALSAKWSPLAGGRHRPGLALQAAFSLPIGAADRFVSSGAFNASLGALASWRRSPFALYAGLRYLYLGEPDWPTVLGFRPHNLAFFACLEWATSNGAAWLVQADGATLPYPYPHPWLGTVSATVSFGTRLRLGRRLLLQIHLSEELLSFASLDISAGAAAVLALR